MGTLIYFIKETFRGFFQAKLMTFVSIITIAITLFFLGCIVVAFLNIHLKFKDVSKRTGIFVVYFKDNLSEDLLKRNKIINQIKNFEEVDSIHLIDKKQAWNEFRENYGSEMLDAVDDNPFPARLDLILNQKFISSNAANILKNKLEQFEGIEGVNYSGKLFSTISKFRNIFLYILPIIVLILMIALHFMIANTIKLTIYARQNLITNMYFVGATDLYIKTPFILEGMLQGMVGGLLCVSCLFLLKLSLFNFSLYWGDWYFIPAIFLIGIIFGWIGSVSAVRKFIV